MFSSRLQLLGIFLLIAVIASAEEDQDFPKTKCRHYEECPLNAKSCKLDDDCSSESICCDSPCGSVCQKQMFSGCETLQRATSRRAKALGANGKKVRIPKCLNSGEFEPIQCDNEIVSSCWCVDEQGFELAGTRAPAVNLVNCTEPKPCAAHTCRMFCPYGFALAPDGCPRCQCRDPCDDIECPNSLDCQAEEIECFDPPCPPIPTCKRGRSLENICPVGDPLRISDTVRPFLCGNSPSAPTCPPLYQCLVQKNMEYGVCCPASLKIEKAGRCPRSTNYECGSPCTYDLECPTVQKCCISDICQSSCVNPENVTECYRQKLLGEVLSVNERMGKGYIPQCSSEGQFEPKQCSRNGLVCWCVDSMGMKIKGSMGAAETVKCSKSNVQIIGRSMDYYRNCPLVDCPAVCEYGFALDENGCHTCVCDNACGGYKCPEDEECVNVREPNCDNFLCPSLPVCRPKTIYTNPCENGTPLTDDLSGTPIACTVGGTQAGTLCPANHVCTSVARSTQSVCCPRIEITNQTIDRSDDSNAEEANDRPQTMCEYLSSFSDNMEGTTDEMKLALPPPSCDSEGNYHPTQCYQSECWCVDQFGTELPNTRKPKNATRDCQKYRENLECDGLTCRMGCDYGFVLDDKTGCSTCQCRDPCSSVECASNSQCQMVEVSCTDRYCAPVPACLPKKSGQCPYLIPGESASCEFECNIDMHCNGSQKCCSNGCGTQCTEPLLLTGCQHHRAVNQHQAHESGTPGSFAFIPECMEDGSYKSVQCDHSRQECWCVDSRGFELSQTRKPLTSNFNCDDKSVSSDCPVFKCKDDCEHGFLLDDKGCRTCKCVDPCSNIKCRGDGEACRLVAVECVNWPCPPVPMCLPKKENPCTTGFPLRIGNTTEEVSCGPDYKTCPSSHKCQLSPLGEYAVCCPKPRDVCFEAVDKGVCSSSELEQKSTRYFFNSTSNKCESFSYSGCQGNHNNFHSKEMCNLVCPVLSQCERLKEKNLKASKRYKKPTFIPQCETSTGKWASIQCLDHVGLCWCVNPRGEPLKGTLGGKLDPDCNFRKARGRSREETFSKLDQELYQYITKLTIRDELETENLNNYHIDFSTATEDFVYKTKCQEKKGTCDEQGRFLPTQCKDRECWCVNSAGNKLDNQSNFREGEFICLPSPVGPIEVTIAFRSQYSVESAKYYTDQLKGIIQSLGGTLENNQVSVRDLGTKALLCSITLLGDRNSDVAYILEKMIREEQMPDMDPDLHMSLFDYKKTQYQTNVPVKRISAIEQREIVSQSPVSMIAPYHTALMVVTAGSAFIIIVLVLLVILYRRKIAYINHSASKAVEGNSIFISTQRPIYVELPKELLTPPSIVRQEKTTDNVSS